MNPYEPDKLDAARESMTGDEDKSKRTRKPAEKPKRSKPALAQKLQRLTARRLKQFKRGIK